VFLLSFGAASLTRGGGSDGEGEKKTHPGVETGRTAPDVSMFFMGMKKNETGYAVRRPHHLFFFRARIVLVG
jgi:hypothetical protein